MSRFNNVAAALPAGSIRERMQSVFSMTLTAGYVPPIVVGGEVRCRFGQQFSIFAESGDREGDDSIVPIFHCEGDADQSLPVVAVEPANGDVLLRAGDDDDFRHYTITPYDSDTNLAGVNSPSCGKCTEGDDVGGLA